MVVLLVSVVPLPAVLGEADGGDVAQASLLTDRGPIEPMADPPEPIDVPDSKDVISGRYPGERFGSQVAGVGNVDNDAYDDFAVLLPSRGYCAVYLGGPNIHESILYPLRGTEYSLSAQSQVRPAGDIDFDGFDDVLITAPDMYVDGMRAAGAVFLFYGSPSGLRETPDKIIVGTVKDMRLGSDVDSAGDINGDGYGDIIIGADGWKDDTGVVYLYLGGPDGLQDDPVWVKEGEAVGDRFGHAVTGAGDLNKDGYLDIAVGAPFATSGEGKGKVYIFYGGKDLSSLDTGDVIEGRMLKSYFGLSVRLVGDVNNDQISDLLISAPKEPTSPHLNAGRVELYLGSEHGIGKDPAWEFEGESDDADLGFNIAFLGDINNDRRDDVAIGAPKHSTDDRSERGKFYVFLGDRNGFRSEPSVIEMGRSAGDQMSAGLAGAGDIDHDGFRDLLVGVPGADTGNGVDVGELQIYHGSDLTMPHLLSNAFGVTNPDAGDLMLVEDRHYQLRMTVTHRTGFETLDHVDIHLDPEGEDVVFRFIETGQNLIEIKDEGDLAEGRFVIPRESVSHRDTWDILIDVKLHWGFPTGRPLSVRMEATDDNGIRRTGRWANTANPVDRLTLPGTMVVTADQQGEVSSGDWVTSSEGLTFSGEAVEYDLSAFVEGGGSGYHPPTGKVVIIVRDDTGGEWSMPSTEGEPFSLEVLTPSTSRPDMTYTLSIEAPDRSKVFHTQQTVLSIDGTEVVFRNPEPSTPVASLRSFTSIEIEDPLGPDLDDPVRTIPVQYRLNRAGDGLGFTTWYDVSTVTGGQNGAVKALVDELFTEGTNYIQWRAWDHVGNGPTTSFIYPIEVDLGNITFSAAVPAVGKWHETETVPVGITIENTQGNPIDLQHLWYRISTSPGEFSPWTEFQGSVPPGDDGSSVTIALNVRFSEGEDNFIQWRARDRERREYITSPLYSILVDLTGPSFIEASPSEQQLVSSRDVTITVVVDDELSGVMDSTILYQVLGESEWHIPLSKTHRGQSIECTARITATEGVDNYVRWQARDAVGHLSQPFDQQVKVDVTAPVFTNFLPTPDATVTDPIVEVGVRVSDPGDRDPSRGVDLRTLQYTVFRPQSGWSAWESPFLSYENPVVPFEDIRVFIEVEDGINEIMWRISDNATPVPNSATSEPIRILVDLPEPGLERPPVIIISEPGRFRYVITDLIRFDAGKSYDTGGEGLSFVWSSDIDGVIGTSSSLSAHLSRGMHTITLTVTTVDSGHTSKAVFHLAVEAPEEAKAPFSALWEQVALVLIITFVAVAFLLQRFRIKEWEV